MAEYLDIYDDNKNRTGKVIERVPKIEVAENEYFLTVQCWILNSKNEILMTRRSFDKSYGGMWEPTGGCVIAGENSIQGIKRELKEEIGLNVKDDELRIIKEVKDKNTFRDIYLLRKDFEINELCFKDNEVIDAKFVTIDEFKLMLNTGEAIYWLDHFVKIYKNL